MMDQKKENIYIIGAGVSGLIAARTLETLGYAPTILEASEQVGGRVKTDKEEGFLLDHGFQVLLDAYPMAKKYLDYDSLELQKFLPGATIFIGGKSYKIGDPLRNLSFLLPTLMSPIGTLSDKFKILSLNKEIKNKTIEEIFDSPEKTTMDYLVEKGFSSKIITTFFRPFYAGIFLEKDLKTSCRMFEFVFKMFGEGNATLPKSGIEAIPDQLEKSLEKTEIRKSTEVEKVNNDSILLKTGETLKSDFTIVATEGGKLIPQMASTLEWTGCTNIYFRTPGLVIKEPLIGLNANPNALVNNIFYMTSLELRSRLDEELLSVTIVKEHGLGFDDLIIEVKKELKKDFGIENPHYLKHFDIPRSLPQLNDLKYQRQPSESLIMENVAMAGDQLLNGSLNAAMVSGETAALAANEVLSGNKFL